MKGPSLRKALRAWARKKKVRPNGTMLIDPRTREKELWIPCKSFAKLVGRSYETILNLTRVKWIPAMEIGDRSVFICMVPRQRALAAFRRLQRDGRITR